MQKSKSQKIKSNIWKLMVIQGLRSFMLIMPISVLFFQENGLEMKEVFLLQAIFSILIIVFEVPSGYFSDKIGRKTSIIIGVIMGFTGLLTYSLSYSFWGFLLAESILGIGYTFISGADSALLYDSLLEIKKESRFKEIMGKLNSIVTSSEGVAGISGGFLAVISLRFPFYVQAIVSFIPILFAFYLVEPKKCTDDKSKNIIRDLVDIVKYSLNGHPKLKWIIIYSSFLSASAITMAWLMQPYYKLTGLPLALFGVAWAVFYFSINIFSLFVEKYEKKLGLKWTLISILFFHVFGYFLISHFKSLFALIFLLLFSLARSINLPVSQDCINKLVDSNIRATVSSVKNLITRLLFSIVGPIIGWLSDSYSLQFAFFLSGIIFFVSGSISLIFLFKHKVV